VAIPRQAADGRLGSRPSARPASAPLPAGVHELSLGPGAAALLAVPPGEAVARPLLVFLHGAGGAGDQSLAAVGGIAAERGVLVLAPTSVAATWDLIAGGLGRDVAVLDAALADVSERAAVSRVAVGGFSDGASYALSLGLANGDLFDAVLAFSPGFVAPPGQEGHPRIWISHGTHDRVLPVERCGRRVSRDLASAGYEVAYDEFDGGHVVTADLVTAALDWWLNKDPAAPHRPEARGGPLQRGR
jgi:phospholipase/carboxylesterase